MNDTEKSDYINAVKCLQSLPPQDTNLTAAKSRFDEFHALHLQKADSVHITVCRVWIYPLHIAHDNFQGEFLPWHRYFVRLYEQALRTECGYGGANPYVSSIPLILLCLQWIFPYFRYWAWEQDADSASSYVALFFVFRFWSR